MYNITVISTNHTESGKCNSDELYKIIKSINPEVIFEELPNSLFNIVYNDNFPSILSDAPLELKCVKKYLQNHNMKHFPVDIDTSQIYLKMKNSSLAHLKKMKIIINSKVSTTPYLTQEGLDFLNSDKYLEFFERKISLEKQILESTTRNNTLLNTYKIFYEEVDKRENAMLQNIYNYSKENQYNRAAFLLGAGHRKSIIKKTLERKKQSEIKLNWMIYYGK